MVIIISESTKMERKIIFQMIVKGVNKRTIEKEIDSATKERRAPKERFEKIDSVTKKNGRKRTIDDRSFFFWYY